MILSSIAVVLAAILLVTTYKTKAQALGDVAFDQTGKIPALQVNERFVHAQAVTPSDTTVLVPSQLYIGTTGTIVSVVTLGGETITFVSPSAGTVLPVIVTKVKAATNATNLIALQ